MKTILISLILIFGFLNSSTLFAQKGRPSHPVVKQQPRVNGTLKATTQANAKAKMHANSNSVFGTKKTHPNYEKRKYKNGQLKMDKEEKVKIKKEKPEIKSKKEKK